jgi:hypothetical protein
MLMHIVPFLSLGAAEDAPYLSHAPFRNASGTRESHWDADMPAFFQGANKQSGMMYNVYDSLDTTPVTYYNSTPTDPTGYQNDDIGQVIGMY